MPREPGWLQPGSRRRRTWEACSCGVSKEADDSRSPAQSNVKGPGREAQYGISCQIFGSQSASVQTPSLPWWLRTFEHRKRSEPSPGRCSECSSLRRQPGQSPRGDRQLSAISCADAAVQPQRLRIEQSTKQSSARSSPLPGTGLFRRDRQCKRSPAAFSPDQAD